jgi:hypothetical protein
MDQNIMDFEEYCENVLDIPLGIINQLPKNKLYEFYEKYYSYLERMNEDD